MHKVTYTGQSNGFGVISFMMNSAHMSLKPWIDRVMPVLLKAPWLEISAEAWKIVRKLAQGMADEGIYEVLEHEATLELKDVQGKRAQVRKRQRVRYLQHNIIAYQDQAWGDGEILLNYRCTPGVEADRYQAGHKTHILISLREAKGRGDIDEFKIEWEFRNGFVRSQEEWGSEVSHRTKALALQIIFPKSRPPQRVWLVEQLSRRTHLLPLGAIRQLGNGRWLVLWKTQRPRLHESYHLKWEW